MFSNIRLIAIVLLALLATAVRADMAIVIDVSLSSPAMRTDQGGSFISAIAPAIAQRIANQPLGARLVVFTAGDHAAVHAPLLDQRIQRMRTASGDRAQAYADGFGRFIQGKLQRLRDDQKPTPSHLTAAVADARRLVRPGQPCELILVTDLAEWDSQGVQYPRDWAKPLPKAPGLNLAGCTVTALGAGQGMPPKPAAAILRHWEQWLKDAGAEAVHLQRF